jgi:hypothetical protein
MPIGLTHCRVGVIPRFAKGRAFAGREAIKRRDHGEETLAQIGRSYNVSGLTIARLIQ